MKDTQTAQFSENRIAHLFKPGTYAINDNVGFYTSVQGLGLNPTDVTGVSYDWVRGEWSLSRDLEVNYMVMAVRR